MISFKASMDNEKIAIIALVIIIAGALSLFLVSSFGGDILDNLFDGSTTPSGGEDVIEDGDCADVHYIGRYASNNTVFDSSYDDVDEKSGGSPLKIFVTTDATKQTPPGYANYTTDYIDGLISRLKGKEEGESYTLEIPPEEAYGKNKLDVGDQFQSTSFALNTINQALSLNQTLEVTKLTENNMSLKWVNVDNYGKFTMPQIVLRDLGATNQQDMLLIPPPYFIWENSSEIINTSDDTVFIKTTPTRTENLYDSFEQIQFGFGQTDIFVVFPNATTASYNETKITLTSDPTVGAKYDYSYSYYGQQILMEYTVKNLTNDTIGLAVQTQGPQGEVQTQNQTVTRTLTFNRTFEFPRYYQNIPAQYQQTLIGPDLERAGYSLHNLAGETLIFEVTIENVYKTSTK